MKHSHSRFIALAVAFVAAVVLALPVTALAGEAGQFKASAPQSESYTGQEHHFKSTVKDKNNNTLEEGKDFIRRYYYTDSRRWNPSSTTEWKDSDDGMTAAGFVWENIHGIGEYEDYADNSIRHSIWTQYQLKVPDVTMEEGEDIPSLTANLNVLTVNPNNPLSLSNFTLSCDAAKKATTHPASTTSPSQPIRRRSPSLTPTTAQKPARASAALTTRATTTISSLATTPAVTFRFRSSPASSPSKRPTPTLS